MLKQLTKLANKLDAMGYYDVASELDEICREAIRWVDKRPESERSRDMAGLEYQQLIPYDREEMSMERVEKELKPRPGEDDPRRWLIDEEGTHEEDRSEPTPEEKLEKEFPGEEEDVDPDELSEEDLSEEYKSERLDEKFSPDLDPDRDKLVEIMEEEQLKNIWPEGE